MGFARFDDLNSQELADGDVRAGGRHACLGGHVA